MDSYLHCTEGWIYNWVRHRAFYSAIYLKAAINVQYVSCKYRPRRLPVGP